MYDERSRSVTCRKGGVHSMVEIIVVAENTTVGNSDKLAVVFRQKRVAEIHQPGPIMGRIAVSLRAADIGEIPADTGVS